MSDLSPPEHTATAAIDEAAAWLSKHPRDRIHRPLVPHLKEAFGFQAAYLTLRYHLSPCIARLVCQLAEIGGRIA